VRSLASFFLFFFANFFLLARWWCVMSDVEQHPSTIVKVEGQEVTMPPIVPDYFDIMGNPFIFLEEEQVIPREIVEIRKSAVGGNGVFMLENIGRHHVFGRYCWNVLCTKPQPEKDSVSFYALQCARGTYTIEVDGMDSRGKVSHWTAMINHSFKPNVQFCLNGDMQSKRRIMAGEELFVDYGFEYWIGCLPEMKDYSERHYLALLTADHQRSKTQKACVASLSKRIDVPAMFARLDAKIAKEASRRRNQDPTQRALQRAADLAFESTLPPQKTLAERIEMHNRKRSAKRSTRAFGTRQKKAAYKRRQYKRRQTGSLSPCASSAAEATDTPMAAEDIERVAKRFKQQNSSIINLSDEEDVAIDEDDTEKDDTECGEDDSNTSVVSTETDSCADDNSSADEDVPIFANRKRLVPEAVLQSHTTQQHVLQSPVPELKILQSQVPELEVFQTPVSSREVIKAEALKQEVVKAEALGQKVSNERILKEKVAKANVVKAEVTKKEAVKEEAGNQKVCKEEVANVKVAKEEPVREEVFKKDIVRVIVRTNKTLVRKRAETTKIRANKKSCLQKLNGTTRKRARSIISEGRPRKFGHISDRPFPDVAFQHSTPCDFSHKDILNIGTPQQLLLRNEFKAFIKWLSPSSKVFCQKVYSGSHLNNFLECCNPKPDLHLPFDAHYWNELDIQQRLHGEKTKDHCAVKSAIEFFARFVAWKQEHTTL
jgi:hypothetical protein